MLCHLNDPVLSLALTTVAFLVLCYFFLSFSLCVYRLKNVWCRAEKLHL